MPVPFHPEKRIAAISNTSTPELLDAVTVLLPQMDTDALEVMHAELARRGIGPDEIGSHLRDLRPLVIRDETGHVPMCSQCRRAAVGSVMVRHKLWGLIPLMNRQRYFCQEHEG